MSSDPVAQHEMFFLDGWKKIAFLFFCFCGFAPINFAAKDSRSNSLDFTHTRPSTRKKALNPFPYIPRISGALNQLFFTSVVTLEGLAKEEDSGDEDFKKYKPQALDKFEKQLAEVGLKPRDVVVVAAQPRRLDNDLYFSVFYLSRKQSQFLESLDGEFGVGLIGELKSFSVLLEYGDEVLGEVLVENLAGDFSKLDLRRYKDLKRPLDATAQFVDLHALQGSLRYFLEKRNLSTEDKKNLLLSVVLRLDPTAAQSYSRQSLRNFKGLVAHGEDVIKLFDSELPRPCRKILNQ